MKNIFKLYLVSFFLLADFIAFAQGGPGDQDGNGDGTGGVEGDDPAPAPINSKLIILLIFGLVFAYFQIKRHRKIS